MKKLLAVLLLSLLLPLPALAGEKKEETAGPSWLEIGGDYRFRFDSLKGKVHDYMQYNPFTTTPYQPAPGYPYFLASPVPGYTAKNDSLFLNRFGLNLKASATEDIDVKARLLMYKVWGHETTTPVQGNFFADRAFGPFDGTMGHVPQDNTLRVDYAYMTWSDIAGAPLWFSIGRRPSTGGPPTNLRQNTERLDTTTGVQALLVDYAFDGLTLGFAPDIPTLPGSFVKFCYGKGFDSGFKTDLPGQIELKDVNMAGLAVVPYSTEKLHIELQVNKGYDIFSAPPDGMNQWIDTGLMSGGQPSGSFIQVWTPVKTNLGDITWLGGLLQGKLGNLNWFASAAMSKTDPNTNTFQMPFFSMDGKTWMNAGFGLLYDDDPMTPEVDKKSHTGSAYYAGVRYDVKNAGTKIGAEYNHGSKYWIGMVPASDDIWTAKLGTRGDVYEVYLIQELKMKPISPRGKAFFRLGYQYYTFDYTGSNSWIGEPKKISDLNTMDPLGTQMFAPLKNAYDIYLTFDVLF
jgi:hypothetical protein